jgi:hypothetical protein
MVLQLVFDPLAYLQYSVLPDHRPAQPLLHHSLGARDLVPGLVAENHAEHHVHGGCGVSVAGVRRYRTDLRTYRSW